MSKDLLTLILGVLVVVLGVLILTVTSYGAACEARLQGSIEDMVNCPACPSVINSLSPKFEAGSDSRQYART